jgi:hypothetical protein
VTRCQMLLFCKPFGLSGIFGQLELLGDDVGLSYVVLPTQVQSTALLRFDRESLDGGSNDNIWQLWKTL